MASQAAQATRLSCCPAPAAAAVAVVIIIVALVAAGGQKVDAATWQLFWQFYSVGHKVLKSFILRLFCSPVPHYQSHDATADDGDLAGSRGNWRRRAGKWQCNLCSCLRHAAKSNLLTI